MGSAEVATIGFIMLMVGSMLWIAYRWLGIDKILEEKIADCIISLVNEKEDI